MPGIPVLAVCDCSTQEQEQYRGLETVLKKCLKLLKALARGNDLVQMRIFERLDNLLKIKVVEVDLAVALREVTCCCSHARRGRYFYPL